MKLYESDYAASVHKMKYQHISTAGNWSKNNNNNSDGQTEILMPKGRLQGNLQLTAILTAIN